MTDGRSEVAPRRIALFGGSFNPPHIAHQLVALYVLETAPVDALWFVPAYQHPFDKPLESFEDRFRMCERAAAALGPRVSVSDVEAQIGGPSRTLNTVRKLYDSYPGHTFSLVIGSDLVGGIESWYGSAELRRLAPLVVVGRGGAGGSGAGAGPRGVMMPEVSSTEIRAALRAGRSVAKLVPRSVLDYIYPRGLYGAREPP
jgi:nicotinate-nucleotide adenylyltransferase